jgi:hypothetical protein
MRGVGCVEKDELQAIVDNGFAVPAGYTAQALMPELLTALGSTDPGLRDGLAYPILEHWIHDRLYAADDLRRMIARLAENLMAGLGEEATDGVFLRAFSVLMLAEIVHQDNLQPFLSEPEVRQLLELALAYQTAERDLRGWVPEKGWAHAVAHTADLLWVLARSRYLSSHDLERLLDAIAERVLTSAMPYLCDEDERLAQPVVAALRRSVIDPAFFADWVARLAEPPEQPSWGDAFLVGQSLATRLNVKQFLRSVYFQLTLPETPPPALAEMLPALVSAIRSLSHWYIRD